MKKTIAAFLLLIPLFTKSQTVGNGILFESKANWTQVEMEATQSGKLIFADVYATWCGPCKLMDKNVYPSEKVGRLANSKFIAIKIQQDRASADNLNVKKWYTDADNLCKRYHITTLPALLFISPEGQLITHAEGFINSDSLAFLFNKALKMSPDDWESRTGIRKERLFFAELKNLAIQAKSIGQEKIADSLAAIYFDSYLLKMSNDSLLTKDNLDFISTFVELTKPKNKLFNLFYDHPKSIDIVTRQGFAQDMINYVVNRDEIEPWLFQNNPKGVEDWNKLTSLLRVKYSDSLAIILTSNASQIAYYNKIKNWKQYAYLIDETIKKYPPQINGHVFANQTMTGNIFQRDDWNLNTSAWEIFLYCNNKDVLRAAVKWSDLSIKISGQEKGFDANDQYYDTKANLLYKSGDTRLAIAEEKKAYEIVKAKAKNKPNDPMVKAYAETIKKMAKGEPTW